MNDTGAPWLVKKKPLAELLGVPTRTIDRWVAGRMITSIKTGYRTRYFDVQKVLLDLERFEVRAIGTPRPQPTARP